MRLVNNLFFAYVIIFLTSEDRKQLSALEGQCGLVVKVSDSRSEHCVFDSSHRDLTCDLGQVTLLRVPRPLNAT
jgi:hypothetical protein